MGPAAAGLPRYRQARRLGRDPGARPPNIGRKRRTGDQPLVDRQRHEAAAFRRSTWTSTALRPSLRRVGRWPTSNIGGIGDFLRVDGHDHVAGRNAAFGCGAVGLDIGDDETLAVLGREPRSGRNPPEAGRWQVQSGRLPARARPAGRHRQRPSLTLTFSHLPLRQTVSSAILARVDGGDLPGKITRHPRPSRRPRRRSRRPPRSRPSWRRGFVLRFGLTSAPLCIGPDPAIRRYPSSPAGSARQASHG